MKHQATSTFISGAVPYGVALKSAGDGINAKKEISLSDRRHIAREIAKLSKSIWKSADQAQLPTLMKMAERLFYEACSTANGGADLKPSMSKAQIGTRASQVT